MLARITLFLSIFASFFLNETFAGGRQIVRKQPSTYKSSSQQLAKAILRHPKIQLLNYHVSGKKDNATADKNIRYAAAGRAARCSYYGRAPGGYTRLDSRMLSTMLTIAKQGNSFRVTEIAGGSHSRKSRHYKGIAFDVDKINGRKVNYRNPHYRRFMKTCRRYGATEVLGPGNRGHSTHLHAAWPR